LSLLIDLLLVLVLIYYTKEYIVLMFCFCLTVFFGEGGYFYAILLNSHICRNFAELWTVDLKIAVANYTRIGAFCQRIFTFSEFKPSLPKTALKHTKRDMNMQWCVVHLLMLCKGPVA